MFLLSGNGSPPGRRTVCDTVEELEDRSGVWAKLMFILFCGLSHATSITPVSGYSDARI